MGLGIIIQNFTVDETNNCKIEFHFFFFFFVQDWKYLFDQLPVEIRQGIYFRL